jgi:hypothetical protein
LPLDSGFVTVRGSIPLFWSQDDSKDWTQIHPPYKVGEGGVGDAVAQLMGFPPMD